MKLSRDHTFRTYTNFSYVCESGGKKCLSFRNFCVPLKWMIPYKKHFLVLVFLTSFRRASRNICEGPKEAFVTHVRQCKLFSTHSFLMHPFSTPWKHKKTVRFSDVFRGVEKVCIGNEGVNGAINVRVVLCITYRILKRNINIQFLVSLPVSEILLIDLKYLKYCIWHTITCILLK